MEGDHERTTEVPRIARTGKTDEAPSFGKPLMNTKAKEGKTVKLVFNGDVDLVQSVLFLIMEARLMRRA